MQDPGSWIRTFLYVPKQSILFKPGSFKPGSCAGGNDWLSDECKPFGAAESAAVVRGLREAGVVELLSTSCAGHCQGLGTCGQVGHRNAARTPKHHLILFIC